MLDICKKLFRTWNETNVQYCHWKSNEHLMEGLTGLTDLDVYVSPQNKPTAEQGLIQNEYIKFVPQKGARYPLVDEWIGFDYETGRLIHVHLHYQIITGTKHSKEYIFPVDRQIIDTRILDPETSVYIASPDIEIIILYCRIVLKANNKKKIALGEDYAREIAYLKPRIHVDILRENCTALMGVSSGTAFFQLISKDTLTAEEWYLIYKIAKKWLRKHKKCSALTAKVRRRYYRLRALKIAILKKYFKKTPISKKTLANAAPSICFLGADGSGKSTVSIEIQKWLNWKIEAQRFYLGSGDHYNSLLKKVLSYGASKMSSAPKKAPTGETETPTVATPKNVKKKQSLKTRILKKGYNFLQSVYLCKISVRSYKTLKKAKKYQKQGGIALFDRFPQNQFVGLYDGPKVADRCLQSGGGIFVKHKAKKEERAIAKAQKYQPDLMFKLLLPPEESVRRKPDHTLEEVRPKAEITEKLVFDHSEVINIDATQPYEQEILEIKRNIWRKLVQYDNRI